MGAAKCNQGFSLFFRLKRTRGVDYLQLVANDRRGAQVRQRVLASLGRLDEIRMDGSLDRLVGAGAALSGRALFLAPPAYDATPELVRDESLAAMLLDMLAQNGPCADILSTFCAPDPVALRRLVAAVTFNGLDAVAHMPRGIRILHELGRQDDQRKADIVTMFALARVPAHSDTGERDELIIAVRPAATSSALPSLTRGLMTFLVMTSHGAPLAAGYWPAHLPPLKMAADVTAEVAQRLGAPAVTVVFDRSFASDAFLSAVGKLKLTFMIALRETSASSATKEAMANWTCHETRPPRRENGGAEGPDPAASVPGLRFIQIVDSTAAERDWRLRNAQMERLRQTAVAVGVASPSAARLQSAHHGLQEAQRWDGVTLLATNLPNNADEVAHCYAMAAAVQAWEQEMSAFGHSLLRIGTSPRDTETLLSGGAAVALVAAFLRHALADLISQRLERPCGWDEISAAIADHGAVRLTQDGRDVTLPFEASPALAGILDALGLQREVRPRRRPGARARRAPGPE